MATESDGLVQDIADTLGAAPSAIRLLLSLFAGYPLACLHRTFFHGKPPSLHHLYFTVTGMAICYFNFGINTIHSAINILVIYFLLMFTGGTKFSVVFAYIFNSLYLLIGYYVTSTEGYDIRWTMPHCVLTLRLIAVTIDLYDGKKNKNSRDHKDTELQSPPSLLQMCGQVYFYGGFLVGPQFSLRRYLHFTEGKYVDPQTKGPPDSLKSGLQRLLLGVLFIAIHQIGGLLFNDQYLLTESFDNLNFILRCLYITIWGKILLYKYIGTWLVTEGACIVTGISYNGKDVNGNNLWDGVMNVSLINYEKCIYFHDLVKCFNFNTNMWMAQYLFKRLRFLGNKMLSQAITLVYLSVWHGLHSGYHMNFFLEFLIMNGEIQMFSLVNKVPLLQKINTSPSLQPVLWIIKKLYFQFCLSYALLSFGLLIWTKYMKVYSSIFYAVHILFIVWPVVNFIILKSFVPNKGDKSRLVSTDQKPMKNE